MFLKVNYKHIILTIMKKVFFVAFLAVACCVVVTSCERYSNSDLIQGQKLTPAEDFTTFKEVIRQDGNIIWLENGRIFASSEFSSLSLEGKRISLGGGRDLRYIGYQHLDGNTGYLYFEGYPVRSIIESFNFIGLKSKVITPVKSKKFRQSRSVFALIRDPNSRQIDLLPAKKIYQMVERK